MKFASKLKTLSLLALAFICSFSCEEEDDLTEIAFMRVNHYVQPTTGTHPLFHGTQTFFVQEGDKIGTGDWKPLSSSIQGLDFKLGYIYDLIVVKKHYPPGTQDVGGPEIKVQSILAKTKVPENTTFTLNLSNGEFNRNVTIGENLNFTTSNGITIDCSSSCGEFAEKFAAQVENDEYSITAVFKHVNSNTIQLVSL